MKKTGLLLIFLLLLSVCGCNTNKITAKNLSADITRTDPVPIALDDEQDHSADKTAEIADFSLELLKKVNGSANTLIAPLSIISSLAMTANGAEKETLSQMEEAFHTDIRSLNEYLYAYLDALPAADQYKVSLANSIWIKDLEAVTVDTSFLQTNKDYYNAEVYKTPFDNRTVKDINTWVNEKTSGQMNNLLEGTLPEDSMMYLVNALSFDADWYMFYGDASVRPGEFFPENGETETVDFLHSTESNYIEIPNAVGFSKPYMDLKYSFVALLPDEGAMAAEFIASLDGLTLINAVKNRSREKVYTSTPKFSYDFEVELSQALKALGVTDAFDEESADFHSLGKSSNGNLFINQVIHKARIAVNEKGTEAGTVTAEELKALSVDPPNPKIINLNRPFFFMIIDNKYCFPIIMGVLGDVKS